MNMAYYLVLINLKSNNIILKTNVCKAKQLLYVSRCFNQYSINIKKTWKTICKDGCLNVTFTNHFGNIIKNLISM